MCLSCFSNADFALTSGLLGAASLRVGARQLLPRARQWARPVSDEEAAAFVASLRPAEADGDATEHDRMLAEH